MSTEEKSPIRLPSRRLKPELVQFLQDIKPGDRIKITQRTRVGSRVWNTEVFGVFRNVNYLATGLSTQRLPQDDVVVPMVHFTKDNGELSSIAVDEHSVIEPA